MIFDIKTDIFMDLSGFSILVNIDIFIFSKESLLFFSEYPLFLLDDI